MTNEYKLAPVVPTDESVKSGWGEYALIDKTTTRDIYTAMLKDAPTVQEVDLDVELFHTLEKTLKPIDFNDKQHVLLDAAMRTIAVLVVENLKQKHGKIYAVKEE